MAQTLHELLAYQIPHVHVVIIHHFSLGISLRQKIPSSEIHQFKTTESFMQRNIEQDNELPEQTVLLFRK